MSLLELCGIEEDVTPIQEEAFDFSLKDFQTNLCCYRRQHITDMLTTLKQLYDTRPESKTWIHDQEEVLSLAHYILEGDWEQVLQSEVAQYFISASREGEGVFTVNSGISGFTSFIEKRVDQYINSCDTQNQEICKYYEMLLLAICFLNMYIQENYTGPQIEEVMNINQYYPFPVFNIKQDNTKSYRKICISFLELDGEVAYPLAKLPLLLVLSRCLFNILSKKQEITAIIPTLNWWCARAAVVHNRTLVDKPVYDLYLIKEEAFKQAILYCESLNDVYMCVRIYIERALAYLYSQETEKAYKYIEKAMKVSEMTCTLTGVSGKKTKFQQYDVSQLFIYAKSKLTNEEESTNKKKKEEEKNKKEEEKKEGNVMDETQQVNIDHSKPHQILLDDIDQENVLLEDMKISDDTQEEYKQQEELCILDQILLISKCIDIKNNNPKFGLITEQMAPYISRVLMHASNWSVYSTGLLYKTYIEYENMRTKERSLLQLQVLYIYTLGYPPSWEMERQLGKRYMSMGICRSALQIFEKLELYEDQIDCLHLMNEIPQAINLITTLIEEQPTPFLWCRLAELKDNVEYFEKSWELSNHHYARAQRGLGRHYFAIGDFENSIRHYNLALSINQLYPDIWFIVGTAYMHTGDMNQAVTCFSRVCQLQPDNGQSWSNLGGTLYKEHRYDEAYQCMTQAVQMLHERWVVWDNMITIAMAAKQYNMVLQALNKYIDLQNKKDIKMDFSLLSQLITAILIKSGLLIESESTITNNNNNNNNNEDKEGEHISESVLNNLRTVIEDTLENNKEDITEEDIENEKKRQEEEYEANNFTLHKLSEFLARMQTVFPKEPKVYDLCIQYYNGTKQDQKINDCLLKKTRAYMIGAWNNDEVSVKNVLSSCYNLLCNTLEQNNKTSEYEVKMLCRTCLKRVEQVYGELNEYKVLKEKLDSIV
ncbi:hypothetical protein WA158_001763 [Blastocystis sp. Blastoise]